MLNLCNILRPCVSTSWCGHQEGVTEDPKKLQKLLNWKSSGIEQFIKARSAHHTQPAPPLPTRAHICKNRTHHATYCLSPPNNGSLYHHHHQDGMALVKETYDTMCLMKNNHRRMRDLLDKWRQTPIFERSNKSSPVEDFDQVGGWLGGWLAGWVGGWATRWVGTGAASACACVYVMCVCECSHVCDHLCVACIVCLH
jgi:hypothetical protein